MTGQSAGAPTGVAPRRRLLVRGGLIALAAGLGVPAGCASRGPGAAVPADPAGDAALLDNVLGLEYEAVAAYASVLGTRLLGPAERGIAEGFAEDHRIHAEALVRLVVALGAAPVAAAPARDYGISAAELAGREGTLRFLLGFEQGLTLAQLGLVPALADRRIAKDAAGIMGVEAMHWAAWRQALGESPAPRPVLG